MKTNENKITKKQREKDVLVKTSELASRGQFKEGLFSLNKYVKKNPNYSEDILLYKAFLLYHHAANVLYSTSKLSNRLKNDAQPYFDEAIVICKNIINKEKTNTVNYLNARLYLAQIYVMNGKYKQALNFAKNTFKLKPSSLTAERIADIYLRSNDFLKAITWYRKSIKESNNLAQKLLAQIAIAICYRKIKREKQAKKEALFALNFLKRSKSKNNLDNIQILGKSLTDNFPEIIKSVKLL
jgi:tetratricopeptide (TPR) repeat protein